MGDNRIGTARSTTFFATGNNLVLRGDMTRRTHLVTLDAQTERPELRQFQGDPVGNVVADRGKYVSACLTIVRAYIVAGKPDTAPASQVSRAGPTPCAPH